MTSSETQPTACADVEPTTRLVPAELEDILDSFAVLFDLVGPVLALDFPLLTRLWRRHVGAVPDDFEGAVRRALRLGYLRRVVVGVEPHILAGSSTPPPRPSLDETAEPETRLETRTPAQPDDSAAAPTRNDSASAEARELEEAAFRLQLAIDAETEKLLLFRVAVVLEVIAGLTLARELALWFAGV